MTAPEQSSYSLDGVVVILRWGRRDNWSNANALDRVRHRMIYFYILLSKILAHSIDLLL